MNEQALAHALQYRFTHTDFLKLALTHRSMGPPHNQRLEFLGDSILGCIIATYLYQTYPDAPEGLLSQFRAHLVNRTTLARLTHRLKLHHHMILGTGESIHTLTEATCADLLEALIGAIFLDSNIETCQQCIYAWYADEFSALLTHTPVIKDHKSQLQEWTQAHQVSRPIYNIDHTVGPEHHPTFHVHCTLQHLNQTLSGQGPSKRAAEQQAAHKMLNWLKHHGHHHD